MLKKIIKLSGILFLIMFLTTLLLSFVNSFTTDVVMKNIERSEKSAMTELVKAEEFSAIADGVFAGISGGEAAGYCVYVSPVGYGGEIEMIVGFNKDLTVSGIKIIQSSETAGLGTRAGEPEFSQRLSGKKPHLSVKKGGGGESEIDAISGATVTTKAVAQGINDAYDILGGVVNGDN